MRNDNRGFTLVEIMVVVVILAALIAVVAPNFIGQADEAKRTKVAMDIKNLETALKAYYLDNGFYPSTDQGLEALVKMPAGEPAPKRWRTGGYVEKGIPKDPWGEEYIFLSPGVHGDFDISSYGPDRVEGGEEKNADINSWELQ